MSFLEMFQLFRLVRFEPFSGPTDHPGVPQEHPRAFQEHYDTPKTLYNHWFYRLKHVFGHRTIQGTDWEMNLFQSYGEHKAHFPDGSLNLTISEIVFQPIQLMVWAVCWVPDCS